MSTLFTGAVLITTLAGIATLFTNDPISRRLERQKDQDRRSNLYLTF